MEREQSYTVRVSSSARRDITSHFYFLAKVSKDAAERLRNTFNKDIRSLEKMPERNPPYERRGVAPGRYRHMLSTGRYRNVYQIVGNTVRVNGIEDCRQDDGSLQS